MTGLSSKRARETRGAPVSREEFMMGKGNGMKSPEPNAILHGGSSEHMSLQERIRHLPDFAEKFKLPRGNRVEHFEPTGMVEWHGGRRLKVFAWVQNTYVAE